MKKSKAAIVINKEGMKILDAKGRVVLDATGEGVQFFEDNSPITEDGIKADVITTKCSKQSKRKNKTNILYKTTLLITMAVVTWKVMKIEKNTRKIDYSLSISTLDLPKLSAKSIASMYSLK